jgi:spermidine synthase
MLIDVVEIDSDIVSVATQWFGFVPDKKLTVQISDGLEYIKKLRLEGLLDYIKKLNLKGLLEYIQSFSFY